MLAVIDFSDEKKNNASTWFTPNEKIIFYTNRGEGEGLLNQEASERNKSIVNVQKERDNAERFAVLVGLISIRCSWRNKKDIVWFR